MEKKYNQATGCYIKRYAQIKKSTTQQVEDYATGCLLDYDYIKNNFRLISVDSSRQK